MNVALILLKSQINVGKHLTRWHAQMLRNFRAKANNSLPPTYSRYWSEGVMRVETLFLLGTITCCLAQKSGNFSSPNIIIMLMDDVSSLFFMCRRDFNETAFTNRGFCEQTFECVTKCTVSAF